MPMQRGLRKRHLFLLLGFCLVAFFILLTSSKERLAITSSLVPPALRSATQIDRSTLTGPVIAPRLGNETAKAELGRAAWKLLHTTMAQFPDKPTEDESTALKSYIHLFQRLYPCGECAEHFGEILQKYPPQVSSRSAAAAWACHVHNKVNEMLGKEVFDCAKIGDFYDCGCADDEKGKDKASTAPMDPKGAEKPEMSDERKEKLRKNGREFDTDLFAAG